MKTKIKSLKDYDKKTEVKHRKETRFSGIGTAKDFKTPLGTIKDLVEVIKPEII